MSPKPPLEVLNTFSFVFNVQKIHQSFFNLDFRMLSCFFNLSVRGRDAEAAATSSST